MGKILYRLFIFLYPLVISLVSAFNNKAKLWVNGRRDVFNLMKQQISTGRPLIWMHCASLGEFEQGRPLLEKLRKQYRSHKILLTFFSPSGFEVRKNYEGADYIYYLPMDGKKNAVEFFDIAKPSLAIFVKYEFWYYYLHEAKKRKVSLLLVSAIFRKSQPFFSKNGNFHRKILSCFTHLFVQNKESVDLLNSIGYITNISLAGDTRFDRVIEVAEGFLPVAAIEAFSLGAEVIVAGSTWIEDDKELAGYVNSQKNIKFIIAPHNIGKERLNQCKRLYTNSILFSAYINEPNPGINTIIIDNIGLLSRLYKYSTVSYIGGGFGAGGIHNVLEAAVYGKPVIFGPEYGKYFEAIELIENGGAVSVGNALELEKELDKLLKKEDYYNFACKSSLDYVYSKKGSTDKILDFIQENRLLTN